MYIKFELNMLFTSIVTIFKIIQNGGLFGNKAFPDTCEICRFPLRIFCIYSTMPILSFTEEILPIALQLQGTTYYSKLALYKKFNNRQ